MTEVDQSCVNVGEGISLLDTGFQRKNMAACYVLEDEGAVAIIETGTKDTVSIILNHLKDKTIPLDEVKYVIVTHVHLDHAGGAGRLMQLLPNAQLVVHEKGARHMIDPSRLQAGATAVYGKAEFDKTYGDLIPVEAGRVLVPEDQDCLELGSRHLTFVNTPGHANHHFCVLDSKTQGFFTGDTFGLAYPELISHKGPFIFPTTTPVQFNPEALKSSIRRLISYQPRCMYLTHYGKIQNPEVLANQLLLQVDQLVELALGLKDEKDRLQKMNEAIVHWLIGQLQNWELSLTEKELVDVIRSDTFLNAQGLDVWLSTL